ncbi:WD40/YVTN/BNR-like repeat-containing protein [Pseudomonas sp. NPDC089530]|uniref:WD40/YVTN/BNR-like repeat-containing protein n=1 Tax=Pseudomonas sp. NPDC089530 TaxID=3390651 RepID=UPI003D0620B7
MKTSIRPGLGLALGLSTSVIAGSAFAAPLADRLERPAQTSPLTGQTLLTDVHRLGERLVLVGEGGRILIRDADGHLQQSSVPVDLLLTAVHFVDDHNGWAVGHDGVILHSVDGGRTWLKQSDGRTISNLMLQWTEAEVARLEATKAAAPDDKTLDGVLEDAYFALDDVKAGIESGPSRPLLGVWFRNPSEGWVVGAYGMILQTQDGGKHWRFLSGLHNPERLHLNSVLGLPDGGLLVAGEGGRLYRLAEGKWQAPQQLTKASLYKLLSLRDGTLLAMGFGGTLLRSADLGRSWQAIELPGKFSLYGGEQLADGSLVLTGQAGVILHSQDLKHFKTWRSPGQTAWLSASVLPTDEIALVGGQGLRTLPLSQLTAQEQP